MLGAISITQLHQAPLLTCHLPISQLPDIGREVVDGSTEGSVEQTNGNSFVFDGVTLTRAALLQHVSELQGALALSMQHHTNNLPSSLDLPLLQTADNKNTSQGTSWQTANW